MKSKKVKNILTAAVVTLTLAAISPASANATWKQDNTGWWYTTEASYATGWKYIDNTWYFFDSNGYMKTGWVSSGTTWYYLDNSGAMKTGWVKDGTAWYYMDNSGAMRTGWINPGNTWYYLDNSGAMKTGFIDINNHKYYFAEDGSMVIGTLTTSDCKYTFAATGELVSTENLNTNTNNITTSNNSTANNGGNESSSTGSSSSGGSSSGGSSSNSSSSTANSTYSSLYGNWKIDSCVEEASKNTKLSPLTLAAAYGETFTVNKDGIKTSIRDISSPNISETVMTGEQVKNKLGAELPGISANNDKVKYITVSSKNSQNKSAELIVANNKVYAVVEGAVFKLDKQ